MVIYFIEIPSFNKTRPINLNAYIFSNVDRCNSCNNNLIKVSLILSKNVSIISAVNFC